MPIYEVRVCETREYKRTYTVEADNAAQAAVKAEAGETIEEAEGTLNAIVNRETISEPRLKT